MCRGLSELEQIYCEARFIALFMLAEGIEIHKFASIIGKLIETIENWHRQYRSKGIECLNEKQIEQLVS
jgi:transposase